MIVYSIVLPETRAAKHSTGAINAAAAVPVIAGLPADTPEIQRRAVISVASGLTQQATADLLGVNRRTVIRWCVDHQEYITQIRCHLDQVLYALRDSCALLALEIGYQALSRYQSRLEPFNASDYYQTVKAVESINRMIEGNSGDDDRAGVVGKRATKGDLQRAAREFRKLQAGLQSG